jgi:5-methylcytosine-specific restriction enzyme subunit McrC
MQGMQSDFLEAMIYVFSCFTIEVFSTSTYNYYETVCEETQAIKGAIDFGSYAKNFGHGRPHSVPCIYDSFQFDNGFNRIVKHVCTLLANATNNPASRKNLDEILFIMDEVEDRKVTIEDCDKVNLNPIHTEFKTILDHCRMFLSSLSTYKWKNEYEVFAFLIPAEALFENFIYSTLRKDQNPRVRKVSRSRGNKGRSHLVRQLPNPAYNRYKMINDMVVRTVDDRFLIFDTKYKKIYGRNRSEDEDVIDNVYNVSQADVYQMVSYAIGSGIDRIGLIYPSLLEDDPAEELPVYEIGDEFNPETVIRIHPIKVDITHELKLALEPKGKLEKVFEKSMDKLKSQLSVAIDHCLSEP